MGETNGRSKFSKVCCLSTLVRRHVLLVWGREGGPASPREISVLLFGRWGRTKSSSCVGLFLIAFRFKIILMPSCIFWHPDPSPSTGWLAGSGGLDRLCHSGLLSYITDQLMKWLGLAAARGPTPMSGGWVAIDGGTGFERSCHHSAG